MKIIITENWPDKMNLCGHLQHVLGKYTSQRTTWRCQRYALTGSLILGQAILKMAEIIVEIIVDWDDCKSQLLAHYTTFYKDSMEKMDFGTRNSTSTQNATDNKLPDLNFTIDYKNPSKSII